MAVDTWKQIHRVLLFWSGGGGWSLKCTASGKWGGGVGEWGGGGLQRVKKVVSNSPGLVDFAIRLVILVLNLPGGLLLCCFLRKFKLQNNC